MPSHCTLHSIAVDVVGQYRDAAKHLLTAYRNGTCRSVAAFGNSVDRLRALGQATDARSNTEHGLADKLVDGVTRMTNGAGDAVDRVSERAVQAMAKFNEQNAWADDLLVVNALRAVNTPAAKLSLRMASGLNDAARRLVGRTDRNDAVTADGAPSAAGDGDAARPGRARRTTAVR